VVGLQVTNAGSGYYGTPTVTIDAGTTTATATAIASSLALNSASSVGGAGNITVNGSVTGSSALTKVGDGTLLIAGATNSYSGAISVNDGTLLVNGSLAASTATTVNTGGTLGGSGGTVTAVTVNAGGTLAPGSIIGTLKDGSTILNAGATFALEIDSTALTTDLLESTGSLSLALTNDALLTVTDLNPAALGAGSFTFITYNGIWNNGLFTVGNQVIDDYDVSTNPNSTSFNIGGNIYQIDYNAGGNSVVLNAVPEPSVLVSLLSGLGMLVGLRRRRA
jgi:fibronectin-binding autotransporter adhesin